MTKWLSQKIEEIKFDIMLERCKKDFPKQYEGMKAEMQEARKSLKRSNKINKRIKKMNSKCK